MSDSLLITTDAFGGTQAISWSFSHATPVYAEMEVYLLTASLTAWYTDAGGSDIQLGKLGFQFDFSGNQLLLSDSDAGGDYDSWFSFYDAAPVVAGTSQGWHTIRWSGTPDGGTLHLAADATDQTSTMPAFGIGNLTSARFGTAGVGVAGQTMYIGRCRVGTTLGGFDLLNYTPALDGDPGTFGFSVDGTIALATAPTPPPSSSEGGGGSGGSTTPSLPLSVGIAYAGAALDATPTWTYLDGTGAVVQDVQIKRGKADEREKTPTGTATISGIDTTGILDPTNATGPHYGNLDPMKQVQILLQHPVSLDYFSLFRGFLSNLSYEVDVSEKFARFELECEDALAIFADSEIIPDVAGNTVPAESTGDVYYTGAQVDDRIKAALADAALSAGVTEWPTALMNIFSGNVSVQGSVYSARSPILGVLQEAAEGEYAGIPQLYVDKEGVVCFRGRETRFDPGTYHPSDNVRVPSQTILYWKIGDRAALVGDADTVLLAEPFRFSRSKADLINCALCAPRGIAEADIAGQFVTDATSVAAYGARSISFENLITEQGDEASPLDALAETKLFATYYVDNYKVPRNRPGQVTITGQDPASSRGPKCWDLLCNIDLGDMPTLTTTHPGGGGFAGIDHFVEGIAYRIVPQVAAHPHVTLVADLVPRAYFATDPFPAHA